MKFFIFILLVFFLSSANSTFWFRNDFERAIDTYKNNLSKDFFPYLRALSIYKRKLQLLGFYPIVLNDDGLEYVSLEPYIIEDDHDDRMYELLKKLKKEKKLRRKLLKEKMKKWQKEIPLTIPTTTTTAKPITNIVYTFPLSMATNPKTDEISNSYQQVLVPPISVLQSLSLNNPKQTHDDDSEESEDNSTESDDIESIAGPISHQPNEEKESKETQTTDSQSDSILQKKLIVGANDDGNNSKSTVQIPRKSVSFTDAEVSGIRQTSMNSTTITSITTPYPLLTVFPDPDEKVIEEILDQQEIVNKISHEGEGNKTVKETVPRTVDYNELTTLSNFNNTVEDYLQKFGDDLSQKSTTGVEGDKLDDVDLLQTTETKYETEIGKDVQQYFEQGRSESGSISPKKYESNGLVEVTDNYLESTTHSSENIVELSSSVPPEVLDFFRDTPSENGQHSSSISSSSNTKVFHTISVSLSTEDPLTSFKITEASQTTDSVDGHLEIYSERYDHILQLNETASSNTQPPDEHLTSSKILPATNQISDTVDIISTGVNYELSSESTSMSKQTETSPQINTDPLSFAIYPRHLGDSFESIGLTDVPAVTETLDDTNSRRSDVKIEADDILHKDATDNLPYNLSSENSLEHSNVIENTSAETSTQQPTSEPMNFDALDEIDREIIPLIPLIIKQIKLGNVSPEEVEILKNTFGQFWSIILEEANRELDSSEEMNPVLSEVLTTASRRVVKREATFNRFRRPIIGRRIYYDDVDDYEYRRRYERLLRRRPVIEYYYK